MRAEDTLQFMADFYPGFYPTRKHCLNHLFCLPGNGYKWKNGELVAENDKYENRYQLRKQIQKAEFENEKRWLEQNKAYKELYEAFGKAIPAKYDFAWHPLCKTHSMLYLAPENIMPDWKALLDECKELLAAEEIVI